uniref:Uncharacterized protein n=1 Tax=Oreochromis aureus TaxID=47969 RepID=A0AAZ1XL82_OREAU
HSPDVWLLCLSQEDGGDLSEPCGGRDCSTCQCFPAKGARVRLPDYSHTCMFSSLQRTCMNFFALN